MLYWGGIKALILGLVSYILIDGTLTKWDNMTEYKKILRFSANLSKDKGAKLWV